MNRKHLFALALLSAICSCSKKDAPDTKFFVRFTENDTAREFLYPILSAKEESADGKLLSFGAFENSSTKKSMLLSAYIYNDADFTTGVVYKERTQFDPSSLSNLIVNYNKNAPGAIAFVSAAYLWPIPVVNYTMPYNCTTTFSEYNSKTMRGNFSGNLYLLEENSSELIVKDSVLIRNGEFYLPGTDY